MRYPSASPGIYSTLIVMGCMLQQVCVNWNLLKGKIRNLLKLARFMNHNRKMSECPYGNPFSSRVVAEGMTVLPRSTPGTISPWMSPTIYRAPVELSSIP